jgi:hypothetical protein
MHLVRLFPLALLGTLAACDATQPADAGHAGAPPAPTTEAASKGGPQTQTEAARMDDLNRFVPEGARIVDTVKGDLTGSGSDDTLLVVAPAATDAATPGEGPARSVILLTRDGSGALTSAAENARMVPCATCGGAVGDPYAFSRIEAGTLTIAVSGGSRERWFDNYVFRYAPGQKDWLLERVVRGASDTMTERQEQIELTGEELGQVTFAAFDPATLPRNATLE